MLAITRTHTISKTLLFHVSLCFHLVHTSFSHFSFFAKIFFAAVAAIRFTLMFFSYHLFAFHFLLTVFVCFHILKIILDFFVCFFLSFFFFCIAVMFAVAKSYCFLFLSKQSTLKVLCAALY